MAESDIPNLPDLLEAQSDDAIAMGRRARDAWDAWFSPEAAFHRVTDWCLDMQNTQTSSWRTPYRVGRQLAHPTYLRSFVRTALDYARLA